MKKYVFKPYNSNFPQLFLQEKGRIASCVNACAIEHIGSTAVPNLGGKGIIDIAIAVPKEEMAKASEELQRLGYEFRPKFSTADRLYFVIFLPDLEEGSRRYHVHLTHLENAEWTQFLRFRDHLRKHPEAMLEYEAMKKQGAAEASEDGAHYRKIKEPMFQKVLIDEAFVRSLVAQQFPQWKDLLVQPIPVSGWDNRTFRLGSEMLIRMPSAADYALQVEKEQRWLPKLAPFLPVKIPTPLAVGEPMDGYPWKWSIYGWLEGETASVGPIDDLCQFAEDLAGFLRRFEEVDTRGGPEAGFHSFYRGGSLLTYDAEVREALSVLDEKIDGSLAMEIWTAALATNWQGKPVWVHGDMSSGNLLVQKGRLTAVIDFGQLAVGDPACDLAIAWTLFSGKSREAFRKALPLDEDTWKRGRAWALWKALRVAGGFTNPNNFESQRAWSILQGIFSASSDEF